jgi:DNA repair exonuclease SbcCD ATPase subunit
MKKLFILLGLLETATEAQAITAVNSLKKSADDANKLVAEANKTIADKDAKIGVLDAAINDANTQLVDAQTEFEKASKEVETTFAEMTASFETAVADKTKELQEQVAELEFRLNESDSIGETKTTNELKAIAKKTMEANELPYVYMVTDGTPFYKEEDALTHARKVGGKHIMYGDKPQEQE